MIGEYTAERASRRRVQRTTHSHETAAAVCEHCLVIIHAADRRACHYRIDEDLWRPIPVGRDVMDDRRWSHVYFAPIWYEDILGEPRSIELAKFTKVKACTRNPLPRSGAQSFQPAKELLGDRPSLECGLLTTILWR
jgi:hypothetical protein